MQHKFDSNLYANDTKYSSETSTPILQVKNLCVYFPIRKGILRRVHDYVKAVDDISFDIYKRTNTRPSRRIWLWKNNSWTSNCQTY